MANIRTAILQAADWIGNHPDDFDFMCVMVPTARKCGTPGCAIGWVNHFAGNRIGSTIGYAEDINAVVGVTITEFYERMDELVAGQKWRYSPGDCAANLRDYADKYFPAAKDLPTGAQVCELIVAKPFREHEAA